MQVETVLDLRQLLTSVKKQALSNFRHPVVAPVRCHGGLPWSLLKGLDLPAAMGSATDHSKLFLRYPQTARVFKVVREYYPAVFQYAQNCWAPGFDG